MMFPFDMSGVFLMIAAFAMVMVGVVPNKGRPTVSLKGTVIIIIACLLCALIMLEMFGVIDLLPKGFSSDPW